VLTKLQVLFSILAGIGIVVFCVAMVSNVNVPTVPDWLSLVAWGSFGVMVGSCLFVVIALALEFRKKAKIAKEPEETAHTDELEPVGAVAEGGPEEAFEESFEETPAEEEANFMEE
jgi:hypothetical protein